MSNVCNSGAVSPYRLQVNRSRERHGLLERVVLGAIVRRGDSEALLLMSTITDANAFLEWHNLLDRQGESATPDDPTGRVHRLGVAVDNALPVTGRHVVDAETGKQRSELRIEARD